MTTAIQHLQRRFDVDTAVPTPAPKVAAEGAEQAVEEVPLPDVPRRRDPDWRRFPFTSGVRLHTGDRSVPPTAAVGKYQRNGWIA